MKKTLFLGVTAWLLLSYGCENTTESTVGSPNDTPIANMSFTIDTTYVSSTSLCAKGKVQNVGPGTKSPPWYVEAQFYTDSTYTLKLGGNYATISVPLSQGQSTFWTITFSSSNVDVRNYPNFRVGDLRAIYKN